MNTVIRSFAVLLTAVFAFGALSESDRNKAVNDAVGMLKRRDFDGVIAKLEPIQKDILAVKQGSLCLAEAYYYRKKYVLAETMYIAVQGLSPDESEELTVLTALGNIYVAVKDYGKGIPIFEKMLVKRPGDPTITFNLGLLYKFKGETAQAIKSFESILAADAGNADAVKQLVSIHQERGDEERALDVLRAAVAKSKNEDIRAAYNNIIVGRNLKKGNEFFEKKEYASAIKMYEEIVAIDATATGVVFRLANAYFNNSDYAKALTTLVSLKENKDILGDAESAYPYYKLLTLTYYEQKKYDAVIESGKKALAYRAADFDVLKAIGRCYENQNDYTRALDYYGKAASANPRDLKILHWSAVLLARDKRYSEAMDKLEKARAGGYRDAEADTLYKDVAVAYYVGGGNALYNEVKDATNIASPAVKAKLDGAVERYRKALDVDRRPVVLISLANASILTKNYTDAEQSLKEALGKDRNYVGAYLSLARLYGEQGKKSEQASVLADLEKLESSATPDVMYQIAVNYEQSGENKKAYDIFMKLRENAAFGAKANEHIGVIIYNRGVKAFNDRDLESAEKFFKDVFTFQPSSKDAEFGIRKVADERKRMRLKQMIAEADKLYDAGEYALAIPKYEAVLGVDESLRNVSMNLAFACFKSKKYYNAITVLQGLVTKNEKDKDAIVLLGRSSTKINDYKNAEQFFKKAVDLDQNDAEVHRYLGELYRDRGDTDRAFSEFKRAKEIALKDTENYNVDASVLLGNMYYARSNYEMAMNEYLEVIKIRPEHPVANVNLGFIFYKKNNLTKALEYIKKGFILKDSPIYKQNLGKVYFFMQEYPAAVAEFRSAYAIVKYDPPDETIDYKWWYAKALAALYKAQKGDRDLVLAYLAECGTNRYDERVRYLARLERLAIEGKQLSVFENNEAIDMNRPPVVYGDKQYLITPGNDIVCQSLESEMTVWRTNESAPLSAPLAVGRHLFYGLENKSMVARRLDTGEKVWELRDLYADRYIAIGNTVICAMRDRGEVVAVRDGAKAWTKSFTDAPPAIAAAGELLFVKGKTSFSVIRPEGGDVIARGEALKFTPVSAVSTANYIAVFGDSARGTTTVSVFSADGKPMGETAVNGVIVPNVAPAATGTTAVFATADGRLSMVSLSVQKGVWSTETGKVDSLAYQDGKLYVTSGKTLKLISPLNGATLTTLPIAADDNKFITIYAKK